LWREQRGTQLLEFALMLPLLLVLAVGSVDFAAAYALKQRLTNAAREGTRIGSELSTIDSTQANPNSVQAIRNAVVEYLDEADLDVSAIGAIPAQSAPFQWTYSGGGAQIIIDRAVIMPVTSGGVTVSDVGTRVTVRYPYTWTFAQVIQIMIQPPPSYTNTILISAASVMRNLAN
jgi:Flp pilus assembly protein TadG